MSEGRVADDVVTKWGEAVAKRGFTQIPNYLLMLNQFLVEEARMTPIEQLVVFQLVGAWWKKDQLPFPSMKTLADRIGASERQVQRAVNVLEKKGFLKRVRRIRRHVIASNAYDMQPLVEILSIVAANLPNQYPRILRDRAQIDPQPKNEVSLEDDFF